MIHGQLTRIELNSTVFLVYFPPAIHEKKSSVTQFKTAFLRRLGLMNMNRFGIIHLAADF